MGGSHQDDTFRPALLVVDLQEDFCPPHGSLALRGGRSIVDAVNDLLELPFTLKIATKDWHPADHISFAVNHSPPNNRPFISTTVVKNPYNEAETDTSRLWPVHCVQDSPGAGLIPELNLDKIHHVVEKGQDARVEMYSAFTDPFEHPSVSTSALRGLLQEAHISHVYVVGLAFDYCVRHTALHSQRYGFQTCIVRDATRAVDPGKGWQEAEEELRAAGVVMIDWQGEELDRVRHLEEGC
ncbi:MAG: hypothetical protein M1823_002640 [Watsoniomyces obsoletus]|nr:MAG: hypothetical protein M1823_002640 [Watsoniomyces obsoletus]